MSPQVKQNAKKLYSTKITTSHSLHKCMYKLLLTKQIPYSEKFSNVFNFNIIVEIAIKSLQSKFKWQI